MILKLATLSAWSSLISQRQIRRKDRTGRLGRYIEPDFTKIVDGVRVTLVRVDYGSASIGESRANRSSQLSQPFKLTRRNDRRSSW